MNEEVLVSIATTHLRITILIIAIFMQYTGNTIYY